MKRSCGPRMQEVSAHIAFGFIYPGMQEQDAQPG